PCALVEPEKLFATREAAELACLLAAIATPRDWSARLRALRTRFFDVPWSDLVHVVDAPDHHPLIARIFDWAQLGARRAYETLFRRIVEDSRFAERALVLGGGERAVTNTWHLLELLLAELAQARSDLHELVGRLRGWMADQTSQTDERDVQRAETDADAVRILTIHKAKGLEAPYVFLYGGMSGGPKGNVQTLRDATGRLIIVGEHDDATTAQLEAATDAENQRLAYVALTRAQIRIYLPLYASLKKDATYQPIQRCLAPLVERAHRGTRVLFERVDVPVDLPELADAPADALASFVAPPAPTTAPLVPLPAARGGLVMLSYTRLAHDLETPMIAARPGEALAIDPAEFDVDDASGTVDVAPLVGPTDLPPGAASGLLLHDVFELADLALASSTANAGAWSEHPEVAAQLADAARARGVDPRYLPHAAQVLHATLTRPLVLTDGSTLPALVDAAALAREVEFSYPLASGRGLVRGFIDALVVYDDELWILDYKSDALAGADLARAAQERVLAHYAVQARLYGLAADRLRGRRKLAGLLFAFVRHGLTVPVRIDDGTLATWAAWLATIAATTDHGSARGEVMA
ncbi:MAG: PD-(D/E)XK nuclease family protein, partial [Deltaproteobacteria bacterium]|nr:PD-(D/E)XK nuclease family protein [Deltaproteobacteria bacterium]